MTQTRFYSSTAVSTTLTAGITNSAVTLTVASVSGFPGSVPYTLILERDTALEEVVTVTGAAGTTLTVTRGSDSTTAVAHSNGAAVVHGVSAREYNEANAHIGASSGVHGAVGSVVGTTDTQTLSGKTLTTPIISSISNTGTLTLPTSTDTLVGRATTDTLTNKSLTSPTVTGTVAGGATYSSPVLTTPTIASFVNATHTHANAAGGGTTLTGVVADAASTIGGVSGTSLAADRTAWTSFSPGLTNTTGGATTAAYKQVGKTLFVRLYVTAGTATASAAVAWTLPLSLTAAAVQAWPTALLVQAVAFSVPAASGTVTSTQSIPASTSLVGLAFNVAIEVA